ncbi:UNKNOWN [Stylonychia lemnae]|uniref:Uncharacterized protein n=1 Tax=Stylonychia lemnae TaxID=5949 RepID=A0A078B6L5_STYLE|nr:UNKNOWN [Stylonychia lemnae]|eukprot:CDW89203.1 UNKNOWN [Stylonychia lemnae]
MTIFQIKSNSNLDQRAKLILAMELITKHFLHLIMLKFMEYIYTHLLYNFKFQPFYLEPFNQHIRWSRLEADNRFHFYIRADRLGELLQYRTKVLENMQTFETSLYNAIANDDTYYPQSTARDQDYDYKQSDYYWMWDGVSQLFLDELYFNLNGSYYNWIKLF